MDIFQLTPEYAPQIAQLIVALTDEIMQRIGDTTHQSFSTDVEKATKLLKALMESENYIVFAAIEDNQLIGFASTCESYAIYANGKFGIIQEFYVLPNFRSQKVGEKILEAVTKYAETVEWQRIELSTPPLPAFEKTVGFYQKNNFARTGGYKMKRMIAK